VTAQLIDSTTRHHLWAEHYDRDLEDVFTIQDDISQSIVGAIEPALGTAEQKRAQLLPPDSLDAWEASQRAFWHYYRSTREDLALAVDDDHATSGTELDRRYRPRDQRNARQWPHCHRAGRQGSTRPCRTWLEPARDGAISQLRKRNAFSMCARLGHEQKLRLHRNGMEI
jgi:hypothetical protein